MSLKEDAYTEKLKRLSLQVQQKAFINEKALHTLHLSIICVDTKWTPDTFNYPVFRDLQQVSPTTVRQP